MDELKVANRRPLDSVSRVPLRRSTYPSTTHQIFNQQKQPLPALEPCQKRRSNMIGGMEYGLLIPKRAMIGRLRRESFSDARR